MKRVIKLIFIFLCVFLPLCGCWDSIEINKRAFVLGIGLDKAEENNEIDVTYEIILPSKIQTAGGEGESGGGDSATWNITKRFPMVMNANFAMNENIDKIIDLNHMQALIIGGDLAIEGIYDDVDFFFRYPQMRRRTKVVYTEGKAKDILSAQPKTTKSPSNFISQILSSNIKYTHTLDHPIDLGEMVQSIRDDFDFVISKVEKVDNDLVINGAAAFKHGKFAANIEPQEAIARGWFIEEISRGNLELNDPQKPEQKIVFTITEGKSKVRPKFENGKVDFTINVDVEGDISEMEDTSFLGTLEVSYLHAVEDTIKEDMLRRINEVYNKYISQKKIDIFRLKRKVKNYNIKFYDENKDRLDDILAESTVNANVTAKIRRVGLTK